MWEERVGDGSVKEVGRGGKRSLKREEGENEESAGSGTG